MVKERIDDKVSKRGEYIARSKKKESGGPKRKRREETKVISYIESTEFKLARLRSLIVTFTPI